MATFTLTTGDDSLVGTDGDDVFQGPRGGNDTIVGGDGWDVLVSGSILSMINHHGVEELRLASTASTSIAAIEGFTRISPTVSRVVWLELEGNGGQISFADRIPPDHVLYLRVESLTSASKIVGSLNGSEIWNYSNLEHTIGGGEGVDHLLGAAGWYYGAGGDDLIEGDQAFGGPGADDVTGFSVAYGGPGNDEVRGNLAFGGDGDDRLLTTYYRSPTSKLFGGAGDDSLSGGDGADSLYGGSGQDTLAGNTGDDLYTVDTRADIVTELADEGTDTVRASVSWALGDNVENLTLTGKKGLYGDGNALDNDLTGNRAKNVLSGKDGDDTLNGRMGADVLWGGLGNDRFVFDTALNGRNVDAIRDFGRGDDTIVLGAAVFTALDTGSLDPLALQTGNGIARSADARILYNTATGALSYDADGSGAGDAIQFALLKPNLTLTTDDFVVV